MKLNYERLGNYIREVDVRNTDLSITNLIGVSMEKCFISSVANMVDVDISTYKILKEGQFACKLMSVGRDEKLPVDLYKQKEPAIVSSAYFVFEPINPSKLLPDYLFMWLCRPENDRYIGFISGGDVRGGISWDTFCEIPIRVPEPDKQKEIVKEYNTIITRIDLNNQLIKKLEETAQAIYKQWFVDFEFPNKDGKPYKSSGGAMEMNFELKKEIPIGWEYISIKEFCVEMKSGGTPSRDNLEYWDENYLPWLKTGEIDNNIIIETEEYISHKGLINSSAKLLPKNTVLMSMYGVNAGDIGILKIEATVNQACCGMICENEKHSAYLYYHLLYNQAFISSQSTGGAQENLSKDYIEKYPILKPNKDLLKRDDFKIIIDNKEILTRQSNLLKKLSGLILSKLATIDN
jgi:type I restriction enzyme, S subunit